MTDNDLFDFIETDPTLEIPNPEEEVERRLRTPITTKKGWVLSLLFPALSAAAGAVVFSADSDFSPRFFQ